MTIYTIGHSTRAFPAFLALLQREDVRRLVDVRTFPASRRYPHFNRELLTRALVDAGIVYTHAPELGGRRAPRPDSRNRVWRNAGFRGYADYMESGAFAEGIDRLIAAAASAPTVIMCAEAVPWRCHRTLIADALAARGVSVRHILDGATKPHSITPFALVRNGCVRYMDTTELRSHQRDLFANDEPDQV